MFTGKIVERAVKSLGNHGVSIDREYWLKEAEAAEKNEPPSLAVCREIVRVTIGSGVEEEDMKRTWKADAVRIVFIEFLLISVRAIRLTSCSIYC